MSSTTNPAELEDPDAAGGRLSNGEADQSSCVSPPPVAAASVDAPPPPQPEHRPVGTTQATTHLYVDPISGNTFSVPPTVLSHHPLPASVLPPTGAAGGSPGGGGGSSGQPHHLSDASSRLDVDSLALASTQDMPGMFGGGPADASHRRLTPRELEISNFFYTSHVRTAKEHQRMLELLQSLHQENSALRTENLQLRDALHGRLNMIVQLENTVRQYQERMQSVMQAAKDGSVAPPLPVPNDEATLGDSRQVSYGTVSAVTATSTGQGQSNSRRSSNLVELRPSTQQNLDSRSGSFDNPILGIAAAANAAFATQGANHLGLNSNNGTASVNTWASFSHVNLPPMPASSNAAPWAPHGSLSSLLPGNPSITTGPLSPNATTLINSGSGAPLVGGLHRGSGSALLSGHLNIGPTREAPSPVVGASTVTTPGGYTAEYWRAVAEQYYAATVALEHDVVWAQILTDRQTLMSREIGFRAHLALIATGERAQIATGSLRRQLFFLEQQRDALDNRLEDAQAAVGSMKQKFSEEVAELNEKVLSLTEKLNGECIPSRRRKGGASPQETGLAPGCSPSCDEMETPSAPTPTPTSDLVEQLQQVRRELAEVTRQRDGTMVALEEAKQTIKQLHIKQTDAPVVPVSDPAEAASADVVSLRSKLSAKSLALRDALEELNELKQHMTMLEARCTTSEVRLHHQAEESVATSILLDRGLRKLHRSQKFAAGGMGGRDDEMAENAADRMVSDVRGTLLQAAMTLRRSLEQLGYDISALPAAPAPGMDVPYLQQILEEHAQMCDAQMKRTVALLAGGAMGGSSTKPPTGVGVVGGGIVPSAMRTPMVQRGDWSPCR